MQVHDGIFGGNGISQRNTRHAGSFTIVTSQESKALTGKYTKQSTQESRTNMELVCKAVFKRPTNHRVNLHGPPAELILITIHPDCAAALGSDPDADKRPARISMTADTPRPPLPTPPSQASPTS